MNPILVLDCGSRSIAELIEAVRAEKVPVVARSVPMQGTITPQDARFPMLATEDLATVEPCGVVISGSPHYQYTPKGRIPPADFFPATIDRGIPILGVCGGHELLAHLIATRHASGKVPRVVAANPSGQHEPPSTTDNPLEFEWHIDHPEARDQGKHLFEGLPARFLVWIYHVHQVRILPQHCTILGATRETPVCAMAYMPPGSSTPLAFGVQFHPEISPAPTRHAIFANFVSWCAGKA